jgi:hypothetical protein
MLNRTRRYAAAALVVPLALLATGCSGDDPAAHDPDHAMSTDSPPTDAPEHHADKAAFIAAVKQAASDLKSAHVTMELKTSKAGQTVTMEGDVDTDPAKPAKRIAMKIAGMGDLEIILISSAIYVKGIPTVASGKWVSMDAKSSLGKQLQGSLGLTDPRLMYDQLDDASTDVKFVATETVEAVQLDNYEVTMDSAKVAGFSSLGVTLPKTINYHVWLDSEDQMRKVSFEQAGIVADMRIDDYNQPVDIAAPPAANMTKLPAA